MSHDTREKILQGAFTVLSRQGYENTSIKDIAEEAGVAQGLVHYYFKSKQHLVVAVLFAVCKKMEVYEGEDQAGALAAFNNFKKLLHARADVHRLYIQLIGVGLHDKEVGEGVRQNIAEERRHVEAIARQALVDRAVDTSPASGIAGAVWGGVLGIIVQKLVDPAFDADAAVDALAAMSVSSVYPSVVGV